MGTPELTEKTTPSMAEAESAKTASPWLSEIRGLYELFRLARGVSTLPEPLRLECRARLERARQKRDTAALLLARGSRAEAWRLSREATDELQKLAATFAEHSTEAPVLELPREAAPLAEPVLEKDVSAAHVDRIHVELGAQYAADRAFTPRLRTRGEVRWLRVFRIAALLFAIGLVGGAVGAWPRTHLRVSASYSPSFPAQNLVDGDLDTEWLGPNGDLGLLDYSFPARNVYAVRLLNGHNHTFLDRGAKEVVVEGYYKKRRVWKGSVSFERVTSERDWKRLDLGGVRVDKLHFEVISYFGSGLALAEIVVE